MTGATGEWPERLLDIPQPDRDRWRAVDECRYWAQLRAEHREEAGAQIAAEVDRARRGHRRATEGATGRHGRTQGSRGGFWRWLGDLLDALADW